MRAERLFGILLAFLVGVSVLLTYRIWQEEPPLLPYARAVEPAPKKEGQLTPADFLWGIGVYRVGDDVRVVYGVPVGALASAVHGPWREGSLLPFPYRAFTFTPLSPFPPPSPPSFAGVVGEEIEELGLWEDLPLAERPARGGSFLRGNHTTYVGEVLPGGWDPLTLYLDRSVSAREIPRGEGRFPLVVPTSEIRLPVYRIAYETPSPEEHLSRLFFDAPNFRAFRERTGAQIFTNGVESVRFGEDGQVTYFAPALRRDEAAHPSPLSSAAIFFNRHGGLLFPAIFVGKEREGGDVILHFVEHVEGFPLLATGPTGPVPFGEIELRMNGPQVVEGRWPLRKRTSLETLPETVTLTPPGGELKGPFPDAVWLVAYEFVEGDSPEQGIARPHAYWWSPQTREFVSAEGKGGGP